MKLALALLTLSLAVASAEDNRFSEPLGFEYWHGDHWDHNGIHVDPPQSVPEASPTLVLTLAAAALAHVRRRK